MSRRNAAGGAAVGVLLAGLVLGGCDTGAGEAAIPPPQTAVGPGPEVGTSTTSPDEAGPDGVGDQEDATSPTSSPGGTPTGVPDMAVTTETTQTAATAVPEELDEGEPADPIVEPVLQVQVEALTEPEEVSEEVLASVADGAALGAIRAQVLEYEVNGWTQVGAPRIVSAEVVSVEPDADPARVEVLVCLDHGDVDVVDGEGVSLVDERAPTRVLQLWRLEEQEGRWVLVEQTFTDETRC